MKLLGSGSEKFWAPAWGGGKVTIQVGTYLWHQTYLQPFACEGSYNGQIVSGTTIFFLFLINDFHYEGIHESKTAMEISRKNNQEKVGHGSMVAGTFRYYGLTLKVKKTYHPLQRGLG